MAKSVYIIFYTLIIFLYSNHAIADIRFIMDTPASSEYKPQKDSYNLDKQALCAHRWLH